MAINGWMAWVFQSLLNEFVERLAKMNAKHYAGQTDLDIDTLCDKHEDKHLGSAIGAC